MTIILLLLRVWAWAVIGASILTVVASARTDRPGPDDDARVLWSCFMAALAGLFLYFVR